MIIFETASTSESGAQVVFAPETQDCDLDFAGKQWICGGAGADTFWYASDAGPGIPTFPRWMFAASGDSNLPILRVSSFEAFCPLLPDLNSCDGAAIRDRPVFTATNGPDTYVHSRGSVRGTGEEQSAYDVNLAGGNDSFTLEYTPATADTSAVFGIVDGLLESGSGNDILIFNGGIINGYVDAGADDDMVVVKTASVGDGSGGTEVLIFQFSNIADSDCDPIAAGNQWICGNEGADTLAYTEDTTGGGLPDWLFDQDPFGSSVENELPSLRTSGFSVYCINEGQGCSLSGALNAGEMTFTATGGVGTYVHAVRFTTLNIDLGGGADFFTLEPNGEDSARAGLILRYGF